MSWLKKYWPFVVGGVLVLIGWGLMGAFFWEAYQWMRRN